LLQETVWGTPGGMRYMHVEGLEKARNLGNPWFLVLEKKQAATGVLCLDLSPLMNDLPKPNAFYIRYFSVSEGLRRKTKVEEAAEAKESKGQGLFKRFSKGFFDKPEQLMAITGIEEALLYAYVEKENARSLEMVMQMGLMPVGEFKTWVFSRFFPKARAQARRMRPDERAKVKAKLEEAYSRHAFFTWDGIFYKDNFFVWEENGEIFAGLQAHDVRWKILEMPGRLGKVIVNVLPKVPLISRLVNPPKHHFAAVEGIFCKAGEEAKLQLLLESVMVELGCHSAVMWWDVKDPLLQRLKGKVKWGLLQRLKDDLPVNVMAKQIGLEGPAEVGTLQSPIYISAYDAT
jgi:hypothetical protein